MSIKPIQSKTLSAKLGETIYPAPFSAVVAGRSKSKLGNIFGLTNFGVNFTQLEPGSASALFHFHSLQDEFIYILEGTPTVKIGDEEYLMQPGECLGFKAGTKLGHQLINNSKEIVRYLEVGDRTPNDSVEYPNDDLKAISTPEGSWLLTHKDGKPY